MTVGEEGSTAVTKTLMMMMMIKDYSNVLLLHTHCVFTKAVFEPETTIAASIATYSAADY